MNTIEIASKPLSAVEVGDQVIITKDLGSHEVVVVEKVSKREIKAGGRRWMISTGYEVGSHRDVWRKSPSIRAATPFLLEKINAQDRYFKADKSLWQAMNHIKYSAENMRKIGDYEPDQCTAKLEAALPHLKAAIEALTSSDQPPTPC